MFHMFWVEPKLTNTPELTLEFWLCHPGDDYCSGLESF